MLCIQTAFVCLLLVAAASAASRTCHGNIDNLHPTGQSNGGVPASERDAQWDLSDLKKHKDCYDQSADKHCIQASVIAAIASRESRGGRLLKKTHGYGFGRRAWGIMQCDLFTSGLPCKSCEWDSCCHIEMMVSRLLVPYINQVARNHPTWSREQQLQGAVAAYNLGVSNVWTWSRLDIGSPHDDYSNDIIARAKYLKKNGWN